MGRRARRCRRPADLQYRIGSITKTMTAVLVLQLRDEGLLDLNDPVGQYLPGIGYGDRTMRDAARPTPRACSPSRSGPWWERVAGRLVRRAARPAIDDRRRRSSRGPLPLQQPRPSRCSARSVARLRGGSWWDAVAAADPGAARDDAHVVPARRRRTRQGYSVHHFAGTLTEEPAHDTGAMAPAGQVWSTVADLARYAAFLVGGHDGCAAARDARRDGHAAVGHPGRASRLRARAPAASRGGSGMLVGHTGSMPGFLAGAVRRPRHVVPGRWCWPTPPPACAPDELAARAAGRLEELRADGRPRLGAGRGGAGAVRRDARRSGTGATPPTRSPGTAAGWH